MAPLISYLITVFNKRADLPNLLQSLRAQSDLDGVEVEFVFADDLSTDGSLSFLMDEAKNDPRIKVISNSENKGPAIRINQAAERALGSFYVPLDADDYLPSNATRLFLDTIRDTGAPVVFGVSKRGPFPPPKTSGDARVTVANDPLAYCARKRIVRMGFMADRRLWERANGADERIFIQDQSLPLRLCANAHRMAYIHDVVYWLRKPIETNLSSNKSQQHHDRFFSMLYQLEDQYISPRAKKELFSQLVSARWKLAREKYSLAFLSAPFFSYIANRVFSLTPSRKQLAIYASQMAEVANVRRILES